MQRHVLTLTLLAIGLAAGAARAELACGDLDLDADSDAADALILRQALAARSVLPLEQALSCDVIAELRGPGLEPAPADLAGRCSLADAAVMQRNGVALPPGIAPACALGAATDCCSANPGVGCNAPNTVECVCAQDASCCTLDWDSTCASLACGTSCDPVCAQGESYCGGACAGREANGSACALACECGSGFCGDAVCSPCSDDLDCGVGQGCVAGQCGSPEGPDATSGAPGFAIDATLPVPAVGVRLASDVGIANGVIRVALDAVGRDPSSSILSGPFFAGVPLQSGSNSSGGNLVDVSLEGVPNDQLIETVLGIAGQGVAGLFAPPDNSVFWYEIARGTLADAMALGAEPLADQDPDWLLARGVILNHTTRIGQQAALLGAATEIAGTTKALAPAVVLRPSFFANVPDSFPILVHLLGATNSHVPITVHQAFSTRGRLLTVQTILAHSLPGGDALAISGAAEGVRIGAAPDKNLDLLSGGPLFFPYPAPPPFSVHTPIFNRAAGPFAFPGDHYGSGAPPWVTFVGRDEPGVSYTWFDPATGAILLARDPLKPDWARMSQLRTPAPILSDNPATPDENEALSSRLHWLRGIAVGAANDAASSTDLAVAALESYPTRTVGSPQFVTDSVVLRGRLSGAPPGTVITVAELGPTFFSPFNPVTQSPSSPTPIPTYCSPVAHPLALTFALQDPVLRTTIRPDGNGAWAATLPRGFSVEVSPGFRLDVATTTYVATALVPGGGTPSALGTRTIGPGTDELDLGTTDVGATTDLGWLEYRIEDIASPGVPIPGMISILLPTGVPLLVDLSFPTGLEEGLERAAIAGNRVMSASGTGTVALKAGEYRLIGSAGIEWEADVTPAPVSIGAGQTQQVTFHLAHVSNEPRTAISADLHVHSGQSADSSVPGEDRLRAALAQGIEILVHTEYDRIGDLSPALAAVAAERPDVGSRLHLLRGAELTPELGWLSPDSAVVPGQGIGHWSAFPLPHTAGRRKGGAPEDEFRSPAIAQVGLRLVDQTLTPSAQHAELVQLNHPRSDTSTQHNDAGDGFLSNLAFALQTTALAGAFGSNSGPVVPIQPLGIQFLVDATALFPTLPLGSLLRGSAGFDTYEVMNGSQEILRYLQNRADWFAFLSRGVIKTATGNSDSHRLRGQGSIRLSQSPLPVSRFDPLGVPRNYLLVPGSPATLTDETIVTALRPSFATPIANGFSLAPPPHVGDGMRSFLTTGPFLDVDVQLGAALHTNPLGRFLDANGSPLVTLTVTVSGPRFVMDEVLELRMYVNDEIQLAVPIPMPGGERVAIFQFVPPPGVDSWVVVEASGIQDASTIYLPLPTSTYANLYPGVPVVALTNPIFFDNTASPLTFDAIGN